MRTFSERDPGCTAVCEKFSYSNKSNMLHQDNRGMQNSEAAFVLG